MLLETTAFVLRSRPLGEADRIVTLFSREHGQLRGVAPRAATSRKRFGGALSVLAEVEVHFRDRPGRDLGRLESCTPIRPTPGGGRDLQAYYASAYLAEVLEAFSRQGEPDERLYRLTRACAESLAAGSEPYAVCRYFEVWTLKLAGLLPELANCPACGRDLAQTGAFSTPHGEVTCPDCGAAAMTSRHHLPPPAVRVLRRFLGEPPERAVGGCKGVEELRAVATFAAGQFRLLLERPFRAADAVSPRRKQDRKRTVVGDQK